MCSRRSRADYLHVVAVCGVSPYQPQPGYESQRLAQSHPRVRVDNNYDFVLEILVIAVSKDRRNEYLDLEYSMTMKNENMSLNEQEEKMSI